MPENPDQCATARYLPWWVRLGQWILTNQGLAVLLLLIQTTLAIWLFNMAVSKGVPAAISQIQIGYERHASQLKDALEHVTKNSEKRDASNKENLKQVLDAAKENGQTMRDIIKEMRQDRQLDAAPRGAPSTVHRPP